VEFSDQVDVLGSTYEARSSHYGSEYIGDDIGMIVNTDSSVGRQFVPLPPSITVHGIYVTNPSGEARITYDVNDDGLYDLRMEINGQPVYSSDPPYPSVSFDVNQNNLPPGTSTIAAIGSMYGVTVPGPSFTATSGYQPATSTKYGTIALPIINEDFTPVVVSFTYDLIESATKVSYSAGPVFGNFLTRSERSSVNLDTSRNNSSVPSMIVAWPVEHTFFSTGYATSMSRVTGPTMPSQGNRFWTLESGGAGWVPAGTGAQACNWYTVIAASGTEVYSGSGTGCLSVSLP
jgi:hypothetical protein